MLSLAQNHFWPICFASFEKLTHQHFGNLAEKIWKRPFTKREGYSGPRMTENEVLPCCEPYMLVCGAAGSSRLRAGVQVAGTMRLFESMFSWIRREDNEVLTIDYVLERAQDAVFRYGIRGLVIDPYNEMEHDRPNSRSETEYISQFLSKVRHPCMCLLCERTFELS